MTALVTRFQVILHADSTPPIIGSGSNFLLRANTINYLGMDGTHLTRIKWPWTSYCIDLWPLDLEAYVHDSVPYNSLMCSVTCRNSVLRRRCGCALNMEVGNVDDVDMCNRGVCSIFFLF